MPDNSNHRPRLRRGRRIPLNVTLAPDAYRELAKLAGGNRSAAIEELVRKHVAERDAKRELALDPA